MVTIKSLLVSSVLLWTFGFCCSLTAAQPESPAVWEKQFPGSIDWYMGTLPDVLLVRADNTLFAIDGKDGRELWSMKGLKVGAGRRNILEIPGTPILLLNRARLPGLNTGGELLAVDLWTGKLLWRQPQTDDFLELIPFYESERVLLISSKTDKPLTVANWVAVTLLTLGRVEPGRFRKLKFQLQDMFGSEVEWVSEYASFFGRGSSVDSVQFYEFDGQLYVREEKESGPLAVGRVDLRTGQRAWKFGKGYSFRRSGGLAQMFADGKPFDGADNPLFVDGKILITGKHVFALDPLVGKPVWTAKNLGAVSGLIEKQGVVFGAGKRGAFALDASSGALRWRVESKGYATNPILFDEGNVLVFCDKSRLVVVDTDSGKILRESPLQHIQEPRFIRKIGRNFLLAVAKKKFALYDVTSGESLWVEKDPGGSLFGAEFLFIAGFLFDAGFSCPRLSWDLRVRLQSAWGTLQARAAEHPTWRKVLDRIEPFLEEDQRDGATYVVWWAENQSKRGRIDPSTGQIEERPFTDLLSASCGDLSLSYSYSGDILRAHKSSRGDED